MTDTLKIYVLPGSWRCSSVLIAAKLSKLKFEVKFVDKTFIKSEQYLKIDPFGKVPAVETAEGPLYESNTIMRYIARKSNTLYGKTPLENIHVDKWLDTLRMDISNVSKFMYPVLGFHAPCLKFDKESFEGSYQMLINALKVVDATLQKAGHLVGDSLTIADIALLSDVNHVIKFVMTEKDRKALPHLLAFYEKSLQIPEVKAVLGPFVLPNQTINYSLEGKCEKKCEKKCDKKDEKKCDKKEEKKCDKKEEKKPQAVAEVEEEPEKPKTYTFPETTFDLFNFKTYYVNEANKKAAVEKLLSEYDKNAFSFWRIRYDKLATECQKLLPTSNLMNGILSRADHCRKYVLGVHGIYGDEPNLEIIGVWFVRGTEILPPLTEHTQYDLLQLTKLNPEVEAERTQIIEYLSNLEEDQDKAEGRTVRVCKYFK